jgi:hypothetical protein
MSEPSETLPPELRWLADAARPLLELAPAAAEAACSHLWQINCLRQQRLLRQRSRHRFPAPNRWIWTERSLAQASDWWSASFKASLFPGGDAVVDACCGAGVDTVALSARGHVTCIDADPMMTALAVGNAAAHAHPVTAVTSCVDRQLLRQLAQEARWLHVDPDRRPAGRRTTTADEFSPSLDQLLESTSLFAGAMIKLAPSTRMSAETEKRVDAGCHRMWVGNRGECRQQLLLTGDLSSATDRRRTAVLAEPSHPVAPAPAPAPHSHSHSLVNVSATAALPGDEPIQGAKIAQFSATCEDDAYVECEMQPGTYIADLHAVLHAAELQLYWGAAHGLRPLGGIHGYFTGESLGQHPKKGSSEISMESSGNKTPWADYFLVKELLPWDDRQVRKWLRGQDCGIVEVKNRMVRLDANAFQRRYSGKGSRALTLLVTQLGDRVRAIVAERV